MTQPVGIPPQFDDLPEPGRTKAFEFLRELMDQGTEEQDAIGQARERARQWMAERVKVGT
jgi:uncharacterized protein YdaT